ncbi:hypothetical protein CF327_g2250 [Tilletia walkeri]|nr:hypothetical protein CF327_g2250 [Tilletia walkeri]
MSGSSPPSHSTGIIWLHLERGGIPDTDAMLPPEIHDWNTDKITIWEMPAHIYTPTPTMIPTRQTKTASSSTNVYSIHLQASPFIGRQRKHQQHQQSRRA